MITRRVLISSSVVAGSLSAIGLHANELSDLVTESPLFTVQHEVAYILSRRSVSRHDDFNQIQFSITQEKFADCTPVKSIVAAEDQLLADARDMHIDHIAQMIEQDHTSKQPLFHISELLKQRRDPQALPFNIVRACNRIAQVSRRGFGNHLLMHPEMFAKLQRFPGLMAPIAPTSVGRWTKVATFTGHTDLLVSQMLPWNHIVAFYRNVRRTRDDRPLRVVDGPIVVINDGGNKLAMIPYLDKIFRFAIPSQAFI